MASFSERYGYTTPSNIIIRERITEPIFNTILNWLEDCKTDTNFKYTYRTWEEYSWVEYFNRKKTDYQVGYTNVYIPFFQSPDNMWYEKLNLLEHIICLFRVGYRGDFDPIIRKLNDKFERLNFAYKIIDDKVVEITSEVEINAIEEALTYTHIGVKTHLQTALQFISAAQQEPNYRKSIGESITAVEACCRDITGASTLDRALKNLESKGIVLNSQLKKGLENLYYYTNDGDTAARHALMDDTNPPTADEAIFMLVSCSAFINYITKKWQNVNKI